MHTHTQRKKDASLLVGEPEIVVRAIVHTRRAGTESDGAGGMGRWSVEAFLRGRGLSLSLSEGGGQREKGRGMPPCGLVPLQLPRKA